MRIVFLGTPQAAVPTLRALAASSHELVAVVTRADKRRGRGSSTSPSPVKLAANELGIPVFTKLSALDEIEADLGVVVAYGLIIPARVLGQLPMLNVHFSLLPRWRGAAPVERAILAGDDVTGVCVMAVEETLDTGPVYARASTSVAAKSLTQLRGELAELGASLLVDVLESPGGLEAPEPQVGEVTYAHKLTSEDFTLTPAMTTQELLRVVRLEAAFTVVAHKRLRILEAANATDVVVSQPRIVVEGERVVLAGPRGGIAVSLVQPEGSRPMPASAWWRGARLTSPVVWGK